MVHCLCTPESGNVGFWTTLLDAEVSHKSLVALLYCLTERSKQVGVALEHSMALPSALVLIGGTCVLYHAYIVSCVSVSVAPIIVSAILAKNIGIDYWQYMY